MQKKFKSNYTAVIMMYQKVSRYYYWRDTYTNSNKKKKEVKEYPGKERKQ